MEKSIISEGRTSAEAIEKGLKKLNLSKDKVDIKIIEEKKKKSFFNILDPHTVKVELSIKEGVIDKRELREEKKQEEISLEDLENGKERIEKFIKEFTKIISEDIKSDIFIKDNNINVNISGGDSSKLIGYRGESLNSLQSILTSIAGKNSEHSIKVLLDIEQYREKRKKTLEELANKIEKTVTKTGKKITLEPMVAYERKIIHSFLQESRNVKTYSIGEEANRRVVITKK